MDIARRQFALAVAAATYLRPSLFEPLSLFHSGENTTAVHLTSAIAR
jgi:hypothetical protein